MTEIVGGIRSRLVHDSFAAFVQSCLGQLGWFDATVYDTPVPGTRKHRPLSLIERPNNWDDPIEVNAMAITAEDTTDEDAELGSLLSNDTRHYSIDIYCENDPIGSHLRDDIRDILRGKMASIGAGNPRLAVYDYREATPSIVFHCDIENVVADRAHNFPKPWQQHWWSIRCDLVDTYGDEDYGG